MYGTKFIQQALQYYSGRNYCVACQIERSHFSKRGLSLLLVLWRFTRISFYHVAELQRELTTTWFDITSTRTCSCWRWAIRGSIRIANATRIQDRRVILAIRVILPPDTTSLSSNYHHHHRIYRIHPLPIQRMHTCTLSTTTAIRESKRGGEWYL